VTLFNLGKYILKKTVSPKSNVVAFSGDSPMVDEVIKYFVPVILSFKYMDLFVSPTTEYIKAPSPKEIDMFA
jgi:hypothetical protein